MNKHLPLSSLHLAWCVYMCGWVNVCVRAMRFSVCRKRGIWRRRRRRREKFDSRAWNGGRAGERLCLRALCMWTNSHRPSSYRWPWRVFFDSFGTHTQGPSMHTRRREHRQTHTHIPYGHTAHPACTFWGLTHWQRTHAHTHTHTYTHTHIHTYTHTHIRTLTRTRTLTLTRTRTHTHTHTHQHTHTHTPTHPPTHTHTHTHQWTAEDGWSHPHIKPYGNLSLAPSCTVFHYALEVCSYELVRVCSVLSLCEEMGIYERVRSLRIEVHEIFLVPRCGIQTFRHHDTAHTAHTHTYIRQNAHTHTRTHAHIHAHLHIHMPTCTHPRTKTYAHAHAHTHTFHTRLHTLTLTHPHYPSHPPVL